LRNRFANIRAPGRFDQSARTSAAGRTSLVQVEAQQAALDSAVEDTVRALRVDPEIARQGGIAGENRGLPSAELFAQHAPELGIELRQSRLRSDALAVRRIGDDQARLAPRRGHGRKRTLLDVDPIAHIGRRAVREGDAHRIGIDVGTDDAAAGRPRRPPRARLGAQPLPKCCVMPAPARKSEVLAPERGRRIAGERSRLDEKRPGAAHRIEQLSAVAGDRRPPGT
jgi:hypothetical protein